MFARPLLRPLAFTMSNSISLALMRSLAASARLCGAVVDHEVVV